jgi:PAS domain S-box-containing protein
LAVDDEPALCVLTKEFLESSSLIKVDTAGSVSEARAMITEKHYDLIVSDYQMPGEDGIQFLRSLRASGDTTPFILFTGKGREEVVIEAFDNGADAYLQKGGEPRSLFVELEHRIGTIVRKHQAEAALLASESEFRTLFENNPNAVILISIEGRILNCNDVAIKILRMGKEKIIGASISDLGVFGSDDVELFRHSLMAREIGGSASPIVSQIHYKDGTTRWVEGRASVVLKAGRCDAFQIIAQDITERKEAEEAMLNAQAQLRNAMDLAKLVRWEYDVDNDMFTFDNQFYSLYGSDEEKEGGRLMSSSTYANRFIPPEEAIVVAEETAKAISTSDPNYIGEVTHTIIRTDGKRRIINVRYGLIKDVKGRTVKTYGANQDITENKRKEEALRASETKLKRAEEVAGFGHWQLDLNGKTISGSNGLMILCGLDKTLINYDEWKKIPLSEYRCLLDKALRDLIEDGKPYDVEFKIRRPREGKIVDVHSVAEYDCDKNMVFGVLQDITERKRAEEMLRQKTALLEAQMAASLDGILVIDENMKRILANRRIVELFNVPKYIMDNDDDNLLLNHVMSLTKNPEKFLEKVTYLNDHINETSQDEIEFKNGMVLDRYSAPVIGEDGKYYGRTWTFHDITKRKRAEEALRESEARYRSLFQDNSAPMFLVAPATGDIADVNQSACKYYGYEMNDFLKLNISQINTLSPEDVKKEMERSIRGEKRKFDFQHRLANGDVRNIEIYSSPIYLDGKPFLYSVVHDVTDRKRIEKALKEQEEQYSKLLATIPDYVIMTDMNGNIVLVNEPTLALSGYASDEVIGHSLVSFIVQEDRSEALKNAELMIDGRLGPVEYRLVMKDGRQIPFEANGDVLRDSGGKPIGLVFVCRDMTERHRMESELKEVKGKLDVMYNITRHDINNQLMALSGYLSLMEKNGLDRTSDQYLKKAEAAAKRISSMVDFTKEYENIGVKEPIWHDIRTLVDKSSKETDFGKIEVINDIPAGTEIFADPMFFKVIQNLMNNSIRHGDKVTKVRLSTEEKGDVGTIVFEDDGMGIPAELKKKLFVEGSGKDHGHGLFLSKEILSITGITIIEEGEPGKGAKFVITPPQDGIRAA